MDRRRNAGGRKKVKRKASLLQSNIFRYLLLIFALVLLSAAMSYWFSHYFSLSSTPSAEPKETGKGSQIFSKEHPERVLFTVNQGDNLETVGMKLVNAGLIGSDKEFVDYVRSEGLNDQIRSGDYKLSAAMPLKRISGILTRPRGASRTLFIQQGITLKDVAKLFKDKDIASEDDFWKTIESARFEGFTFLPGEKSRERLEGYLFPGTYEYEDNMSAEDVLSIVLDTFQTQYGKIPQKTNGLNDRDTVILASMLEREARSDGEKPAIASVYINRLKADMFLQCDATIVYAKPEHQGNLTFADYKFESPYNTYLHKGLPPTPICNPGMPSLLAAADPAKTEYLFYLYNTQSKNAHVFAKTYEEHLENRKTYGYDD